MGEFVIQKGKKFVRIINLHTFSYGLSNCGEAENIWKYKTWVLHLN